MPLPLSLLNDAVYTGSLVTTRECAIVKAGVGGRHTPGWLGLAHGVAASQDVFLALKAHLVH